MPSQKRRNAGFSRDSHIPQPGLGIIQISALIPRSYHKINTGPFVQTPFGLRLLRQAEIERLHGHTLLTRHYATAVQMLGQGVQTRVFRLVFRQLADHLANATPAPAPV